MRVQKKHDRMEKKPLKEIEVELELDASVLEEDLTSAGRFFTTEPPGKPIRRQVIPAESPKLMQQKRVVVPVPFLNL